MTTSKNEEMEMILKLGQWLYFARQLKRHLGHIFMLIAHNTANHLEVAEFSNF